MIIRLYVKQTIYFLPPVKSGSQIFLLDNPSTVIILSKCTPDSFIVISFCNVYIFEHPLTFYTLLFGFVYN